MTYRRDKKRFSKFFVRGIVTIGVVALFLWTPLFSYISQGFQYIALPVWHGGASVSDTVSSWVGFFKSKETLEKENTELKKQLEEISFRLLDRNLLWEENIDLRERLGRADYEELKVLARVLAGPGRAPYDTLVLDIGSHSGVKVGDIVTYGNSVEIGKITEVFNTSSRAVLYSSPGETINVVLGADQIPAQATGRGSGNFEITIPRDTAVVEGDPIRVVSRYQRTAGVVEHIESNPNDAFKTILFKSPVNVFDIKWVEIIKSET